MKNKFILLLLLICFLLLVSCEKPNNPDQNTEVNYTVTFNTDGGSAVESQTVKEGEKAVKPQDPKKEGFVFVNWFNGEVIFDFETPITADIELKATWEKETAEPITYTVTFNTNGGNLIDSQVVVFGEYATQPDDPVREGFVFIDWFNGDTPYDFETIVTSDIELTAVWTERITEIALSYNEDDLEKILLSINDLDISLDISNNTVFKTLLLSLKLYRDYEYRGASNRISKYVLSFSNYEFTIYDDGTICYIDSENEYDYLFCTDNKLDYLETLYDSEILDFNNYNENQLIRVFNSQDDFVSIENKNDFLNNLKQVKYFKLMYPDYYELGELIYQIQIDEDLICIYSDYIMINDNLYKCIDGDFYFLNDLKFSFSSGWLPWV